MSLDHAGGLRAHRLPQRPLQPLEVLPRVRIEVGADRLPSERRDIRAPLPRELPQPFELAAREPQRQAVSLRVLARGSHAFALFFRAPCPDSVAVSDSGSY